MMIASSGDSVGVNVMEPWHGVMRRLHGTGRAPRTTDTFLQLHAWRHSLRPTLARCQAEDADSGKENAVRKSSVGRCRFIGIPDTLTSTLHATLGRDI
jgi:hypothetical protein